MYQQNQNIQDLAASAVKQIEASKFDAIEFIYLNNPADFRLAMAKVHGVKPLFGTNADVAASVKRLISQGDINTLATSLAMVRFNANPESQNGFTANPKFWAMLGLDYPVATQQNFIPFINKYILNQ